MDGANVDVLSRWIAIRLSRRAFIGPIAALAIVGWPASRPTVARKRRKNSPAARQRDRRKRRFDALLSSFEPDVQGEIVGGSVVPQGTHAFTTFVQVALGNNSFVACTGSLITPRHVLTAAHCVVNDANQTFAADQFLTAVGRAHIQNVPADNIWAIAAVHKHPDYDPDTIRNDVAVLQLESDVPASIARPVALVGSNDARFDGPGQTATVAGLG